MERTPRPNGTRSRRCVVDQVRSLQMKTASTEIAHFQGCIFSQTFLHGAVPLLNVLRRSMRIEGRKADRRCRQWARTQDWSAEIQSVRIERCRGREVVRLLGFGEHIRNVVTLVAPRVLIYRREEDAVRGMQREPAVGKALGDSYARRKVVLIRIHQTFRIPLSPADEYRGNTTRENQVRVGIVLVVKRVGVFVAYAKAYS